MKGDRHSVEKAKQFMSTKEELERERGDFQFACVNLMHNPSIRKQWFARETNTFMIRFKTVSNFQIWRKN